MSFEQFDPRVLTSYSLIPPCPLYDDLAVQAEMVFDDVRTGAFRKAIESRVSGKIVVDIGTGTGLLSIIAAQAGASRVYAIEDKSVITFAQRFSGERGYSDRITFVRGYSTNITLPEKGDVLVS